MPSLSPKNLDSGGVERGIRERTMRELGKATSLAEDCSSQVLLVHSHQYSGEPG